MNTIQVSFVLLLAIAFACARGHGGHGGGYHSGEHESKNCTIVPAGTTNCTGVTGTNCTDQTNLKTLLAANTTSVLVCRGRAKTPVSGTVEVELGQDLDDCRGPKCTCFTVAAAETRYT